MLQVRFDGAKYIAKLSKSEKDLVRRSGFLWDTIDNKWTTHDAKVAYRLFDHCDQETQKYILDELNLNTFKVPEKIKFAANRRTPFAHQIEGAEWVMSRKASALAFEAGTGKSLIAALCLNTSFGPTIIVCPSFLKLNWEYELEQGLIDYAVIQIFKKNSDEINPAADIYIVPDSLIGTENFRQKFFALGKKFKYIFVDEYQKFKSESANRTRSLVGGNRLIYVKKNKWKGFQTITEHFASFSGTPMPNRPLELHYYTSRVAPHAVNYLDKHRFGLKFCAGFESEWGWDYSGASNLEELHKILTRDFMLVKKIDDCIDLPIKLPSEFIFLEDKRGKLLKKKEMHLLEKLTLQQLISLQCEADESFQIKVQEKIEENPNGMIGFLSDLRVLLGQNKVKQVVKIIKEMLETREKIVLFAWHQSVVQELCDALDEYKPLKVTGAVSNKKRHQHVQDFQNKKEHRLFIANIQAAGVGLTLTEASCVCFIEPSWVPSDNDQAIARCRRIGQTKPVESYYFVFKNSLDHMILNAHQNKNEVIDQVIKTKGQNVDSK